jgi:hypothetical protein
MQIYVAPLNIMVRGLMESNSLIEVIVQMKL